jgi:DNA-binding transcriptional LysR family regulator
LGVNLFDRRRTGYVPTAEGSEVIALAERVELDVVSVAQRVSSHVQGHTGELRVTTSDSLLLHFLTPIIAEFKVHNPAIRVDVIVANNSLNLARGESDIAVRATKTPPENLFGRKVATIAWALYGRRSNFICRAPLLDDLYDRQWTSYCGALSGLEAAKFIEARVPQENIAYRADSVAGVAAAIAAGLGIGYLPCMLGDLDPNLLRIGAVERELSDELWLLTHPDIKKAGRVYAFMTHCTKVIAKYRDFIEGNGSLLSRYDLMGADC